MNIDDAMHGLLALVPKLSDEEWAVRDARVAAEQRRSAQPDPRDRLLELLGNGFPQRAINAVDAGPDLAKPAIAWLSAHPVVDDIVVMSGPKGTGKTVAATWWAATQRRDPVRMVRASTFARTSRYDEKTRELWLGGPLVLDDLGAEYVDAKGSFLTDLDELIDTFYGNLVPMLITTNCEGKQFRERYGERIMDRLRECGRWVSVGGESMRKRVT